MSPPARLLSLALLLPLAGCGRIVVTAQDCIVGPDGRAELTAFVEREPFQGIRRSVNTARVDFTLDGRPVGTVTTTGDGRAVLTVDLPPGVADFDVRARYKGHDLRDRGRAFRWDPTRTAVAVDIDDTLSHTDYAVLLFREEDDRSDPLRGSRAAMNTLALDFHIVYLTGRTRFLADKTRHWLESRGYPPGPIVTAPRIRDTILQPFFKRQALTELRARWPNLLIGIGDRWVDTFAYEPNGLLTLLVDGDDETTPDRAVFRFARWRRIAEFCRLNRSMLNPADVLHTALDARANFLLPPPDPAPKSANSLAAPTLGSDDDADD